MASEGRGFPPTPRRGPHGAGLKAEGRSGACPLDGGIPLGGPDAGPGLGKGLAGRSLPESLRPCERTREPAGLSSQGLQAPAARGGLHPRCPCPSPPPQVPGGNVQRAGLLAVVLLPLPVVLCDHARAADPPLRLPGPSLPEGAPPLHRLEQQHSESPVLASHCHSGDPRPDLLPRSVPLPSPRDPLTHFPAPGEPGPPHHLGPNPITTSSSHPGPVSASRVRK